MEWAYLDRALQAQGAGAWGRTVSRTDNTTIRTHEDGEIFEIEGLPIGEESSEPNPGVRRQERRGNIAEPVGVPGHHVATSKPPPAPPTRGSRPETPERVEEDSKGRGGESRRINNQETERAMPRYKRKSKRKRQR